MVKAEEYKKYQMLKKVVLIAGVVTLPIIRLYTEYIALWLGLAIIINNRMLGNDYKIDNYIKISALSEKKLLILNNEADKRANRASKISKVFLALAILAFIIINNVSYFQPVVNQIIICLFTGFFAVFKYDEHMYRDFDSRVTHEIIAREERKNITENDKYELEDLINMGN
ncbi:MAG: hypothetical protein N4A47_01125 [Clostridia bacterium]|nr:hypothetical protein [Clostridia bacterium]